MSQYQPTCLLQAPAPSQMSVCLRYFKVLIQEMDLKLDLGFVYAVLDLFTPENHSITSSEQEV